MMRKIINNIIQNFLVYLILGLVASLCTVFILRGTRTENGAITLDGNEPKIEEYTEKFIENANDALYRIMNEDAPTDEETIKANDEVVGLGGSVTLETVISRRLPDGDTDNGKGWQCSKYTAYLATGKREYSSAHPDYGPVNGKDIAKWLVNNYGWKYIDTPVYGAIGSGGFNTTYGHTAMFLYYTGANTAMVNDANYVPLTVSTHNMNVSGWVWVVPGDYTPDPEPTPTPTPTPVDQCKQWEVKIGDTMGKIMKTCLGKIEWGETMLEYAKHWYSVKYKKYPTVYDGWASKGRYGLFAGDIIEYR